MIIDPFGDIIAECRSFDDSLVTATITAEKLQQAEWNKIYKARRPDLYKHIIGQQHQPEQKVVWLNAE